MTNVFEVRCGYTVSESQKKVWEVELSILGEFVRICDKYGLSYFADGGTMLGAVRHHGFIPWDNDIDVAMPRPDFNKLMEIGANEFSHPFFLQSPITEDGRYFRTWLKICRSDTTGSSFEEFKKGINCGIFIDVFPLDKIPENRILRKLFLWKLDSIQKSVKFCFTNNVPNDIVLKIKYALRSIWYKYVLMSPDAKELFSMFHNAAGKYWNSNSNIIADLSHGYVDRFAWRTTDWEKHITVDFENTTIIIPKGYDAILTKQYGNYMDFPKDKSTHSYLVFDPETPYTDFFSKL